jgi:hypothetical protein
LFPKCLSETFFDIELTNAIRRPAFDIPGLCEAEAVPTFNGRAGRAYDNTSAGTIKVNKLVGFWFFQASNHSHLY